VASWAWPHTPNSSFARIVLADGPFAGQEIGFVPPDTGSPAQVVWSAWLTGVGFTAYLYEWHGEVTTDRGRTDALLFRATGRRLAALEMPPLLGEDVEVWADGAALIVSATQVPAEMIWPGL